MLSGNTKKEKNSKDLSSRLNEYKRMIMGDMKTPDFDDLLAAFDIPDMVDPKAAIESGHDEHDNHVKQNAQGDDDAHVPSSSDVGVSVIVKNVRTIESSEASEKDTHHSAGNGLHNGFLTISNLERFNKESLKSLKEKAMVSGNVQKDSVFNQFSPISSAEEFDDDEKIEVDDPPDRVDLTTGFGSNLLPASTFERDKIKTVEHLMKSANALPSNGSKSKECQKEVYDVKVKKDEKLKEGAHGKVQSEKGEVNGESLSQLKLKSSAKLSSCIAAIAALSAKKTAYDPKDMQSNTEESTLVPKEINNSPLGNVKCPDAQLTVQNLIDGAKKTPVKPSDSPRSVSSENSSKGSPSSGGSTPAIPKVRIKTIKTSSGEIKRTVTRVLPDFDAEGTKQPSDQSPSTVASPVLSSHTSAAAILSSPSRPSVQTIPSTNPASSTDGLPKQVTIKPVATAFLPVSAVKTAGSQVINLKFGNNTVKATVISAASVESTSNAIIKAANAIQQQTVVVPASSLANAKLVPKTVHFANLNLLPQGSQTTTELRQVLTKPQQQIKQTLVPTTVVTPTKKVSRVQVVASSQSSVVEAFNKVLSSVNPVPVYIPNLSPPTNAGISLPARGYKCLECGDSFALEKSLLQHYDRRSVRIEVTCNHCTKNLVFYNKCSLLSHARGHKEKGVVMQCSHLILKPVPVDQMIASSSPNSVSTPTTPAPRQGPTVVVAHTLAKVPAGASSPVISAPITAPVTPAMPLDEDSSKLCRHSLKCLECNEAFPDETSLATHFQQVVDTSGQPWDHRKLPLAMERSRERGEERERRQMVKCTYDKHYRLLCRFFQVATFCFDDCFAHSWHSLDELQEVVTENGLHFSGVPCQV
ncbi:unnamed protein product [Ranitomeya imitator]|uniref:C2H2-type domain-containing protein n=1 Tax=Ranitomeya imitator TaxID=111125 RepID=A0ABN9LMF1_9NEOB|nr:unnamed protein product [Ranitomeya imitator]